MSLEAIFQDVESVQQEVLVNLASGLRIFKELQRDSQAISSLIRYLADHPDDKAKINDRVQELLLEEYDPTAVRPQDTAIASYLFALYQIDSRLAHELALQLLQVTNLWWSALLANDIANEKSS